jgi:hypothetical protein
MPSGGKFCPGQSSSEVNGASQRGLLVAVGWAISAGLARQGCSWSAQSDKEVPSNRSRLVINLHPIVRDIRTEHDISQKIEIERLNDDEIVGWESSVGGR